MTKRLLMAAVFAAGAAVVLWVGWGFVERSPLALVMTVLIALAYVVGAMELWRYSQATASLTRALADTTAAEAGGVNAWVERAHPSLRGPVRLRLEGARVPLPGPALTPYLVGLLVMLGMLGTFLGMVVTFSGAVAALESSSSLESIRAALAAPIKGLGLAFGTSVAGVATSAMLGLLSAMVRRDRAEAARALDAAAAGALRPWSAAQRQDDLLQALHAQAHALPIIAQQLQDVAQGLDRRHEQLREQLVEQQHGFFREATASYGALADAVGTSLRESLGSAAQQVAQSVEPIVQHAMAGLAEEAQQSHGRLRESTDAHLRALSAQWEATGQRVADTWTTALHSHADSQQVLLERLDGAVAAVAQVVDARSQALLTSLHDAVAQSAAAQDAAQRRQLEVWQVATEAGTRAVTAEWQRMGDEAAAQQRVVCEALGAAASRLDGAVLRVDEALHQRSAAFVAAVEDVITASHVAQARADEQRLSGWARTLDGATARMAGQWEQSTRQAAEQQRAAARALQEASAQLAERAEAQVDEVLGSAARLMQQSDELLQRRMQAETQWEQAQAARMDALAGIWRAELSALRDAEAERGHAAVQRLDTLQAAAAQHLASLGASLEEPLNRLLQTASDVPKAAAEVITQLRSEMAGLSERDNAALAERAEMTAQLSALLRSLQDAASLQREAIDALVGNANAAMEQAVQRFAQALAAQATKADDIAAHVSASAVELASLGEAFTHGVDLFAASNERLLQAMGTMEAAIGRSMDRSDEQMAYYVAQAREVIDLSLSSQHAIVEDLRRLQGAKQAGAAPRPAQGVAA